MPRVERIQDAIAANQRSTVRRAFHNKGTVVSIRFDVAPALPEVLRVGFLRPGASYPGFAASRDRRASTSRWRPRSARVRISPGDRRRRAGRAAVQYPGELRARPGPVPDGHDTVRRARIAHRRHPCPARSRAPRGHPDPARPPACAGPDRCLHRPRYWSRTAFQVGDAVARLFARPTADVRRVEIKDDPDFLTTDLAEDLRRAPDHLSCAPSCSSTRRGRRSKTRARSGTRASPRRS